MAFAGEQINSSDVFGMVDFTPVWSDLTLGTGAVNEGWYQRIGDLVTWGFRTQIGTSPSGTGSSYRVDLPVAAWVGGGSSLQAAVGAGIYRATGTTNWVLVPSVFSSSGLSVAFTVGDSGGGRASSTTPVAVASGHVISASGVYRAA